MRVNLSPLQIMIKQRKIKNHFFNNPPSKVKFFSYFFRLNSFPIVKKNMSRQSRVFRQNSLMIGLRSWANRKPQGTMFDSNNPGLNWERKKLGLSDALDVKCRALVIKHQCNLSSTKLPDVHRIRKNRL